MLSSFCKDSRKIKLLIRKNFPGLYYVQFQLRKKCPNTKYFLVLIFPYLDWTRTRKNSALGHFLSPNFSSVLTHFLPMLSYRKEPIDYADRMHKNSSGRVQSSTLTKIALLHTLFQTLRRCKISGLVSVWLKHLLDMV